MIGKVTSNIAISKSLYAEIINKAKAPVKNTPALDITKAQYEKDTFSKSNGCGGGCIDDDGGCGCGGGCL